MGLFTPEGHQPKDLLTDIMTQVGFTDVQDHVRFFTLFGTIGYFNGIKR